MINRDQTGLAGGSYDGQIVGDRFQLARAPTLLACTTSIGPIGFTRLRSDRPGTTRAKDVPPEAAFSMHVALRPSQVALWIDGRHALSAAPAAGDTFLFDLNSNPVSELSGPFDILRFYIAQTSLDDLAADQGVRGPTRLAMQRLGANDPVMHGLALALLDPVERAGEHSALFVDHIGLAFHAHATRAYGVADSVREGGGGLSAWQLRRAFDYVASHLQGDPTVAQLARECELSPGYFARAFRKTTGLTPHRWLTRRRVARARELLLTSRLELADIAILCGFVDQSHLTRVFGKVEGQSPGRWRRERRALS